MRSLISMFIFTGRSTRKFAMDRQTSFVHAICLGRTHAFRFLSCYGTWRNSVLLWSELFGWKKRLDLRELHIHRIHGYGNCVFQLEKVNDCQGHVFIILFILLQRHSNPMVTWALERAIWILWTLGNKGWFWRLVLTIAYFCVNNSMETERNFGVWPVKGSYSTKVGIFH